MTEHGMAAVWRSALPARSRQNQTVKQNVIIFET